MGDANWVSSGREPTGDPSAGVVSEGRDWEEEEEEGEEEEVVGLLVGVVNVCEERIAAVAADICAAVMGLTKGSVDADKLTDEREIDWRVGTLND